MSKQRIGGLTAVSIAIDFITIIVLARWNTTLTNQLQTLTAINAAGLGGIFVLFCFSVYFLKKLEPENNRLPVTWIPNQLLSVNGQRVLGILFGIALALSVAHQLGYMEAIFVVDDRVLGAGESSAFFVYGPASWLGAGLIYMLILSSATPPRFKRAERRYVPVAALGLLGVNLMLVWATAELNAAIHASGIFWSVPVFIILAVLFIPTRLVFFTKHPQVSTLISFGIMLLAATYSIVNG